MNPPNEPSPAPTEEKPFDWRGYFRSVGRVLAYDLAAVLAITLVIGPRDRAGFVNFLFWSAAVLMGIAALPVFGSMGASYTLSRRVTQSGEDFRDLMRKEHEKRRRDEPTTFVFGTAGVLAFLISLVFSA